MLEQLRYLFRVKDKAKISKTVLIYTKLNGKYVCPIDRCGEFPRGGTIAITNVADDCGEYHRLSDWW